MLQEEVAAAASTWSTSTTWTRWPRLWTPWTLTTRLSNGSAQILAEEANWPQVASCAHRASWPCFWSIVVEEAPW